MIAPTSPQRISWAYRIALVLAVLGIFDAAASVWLGFSRPSLQGFVAYAATNAATDIAFAFFPVVGALIARRQPHNFYWILLTLAGLLDITLPYQYTAYTVLHPGALPLAAVATWLTTWPSFIGLSTAALGLLLFPTGRPPNPRWRKLVVMIGLNILIGFLAVGLSYGPVGSGPGSPLNPLGIQGLSGIIVWIGFAAYMLTILFLLIALVNMLIRFRHSKGDQRQQFKWLLTMVAFLPLGIILGTFFNNGTSLSDLAAALTAIGVAGYPLGVGVAMYKYRLYDIDIVISRALVYGSLAVLITAIYIAIAVGLGFLVGSGGKPNLALSILATAIVALGFQPVRERLQKIANRLVYGQRANPYEVLSQFSERVAESYASDEVLPRMARVLAQGTNADLAEVWLRQGEELRRASTFPLDTAPTDSIPFDPITPFVIPNADKTVPVTNQGELLGVLTVTKRRGEQLSPIENKLIADLANQAGLVLKNVGLTADLQARLIDLRASRQRLVAAQDNERRKLERNLHDGAQQYLVAIKVKLGLVELLLAKDPVKARQTLEQLKTDADEALETLRDLARGIYPPLLAEKGLPTALLAQARKATLPITVATEGLGRYSQDIEAALYFCTLEALQNIQKYAQAHHATVSIQASKNQLEVEVKDDGQGFVVSQTARGHGLTNMEDRLDALGGKLQLTSLPGHGTTLRISLPVFPASLLGAT